MKIKRGNGLITYTCDACKATIPNGRDGKMTLRIGEDLLQWDIGEECVPELKKLFGEGRELKPPMGAWEKRPGKQVQRRDH